MSLRINNNDPDLIDGGFDYNEDGVSGLFKAGGTGEWRRDRKFRRIVDHCSEKGHRQVNRLIVKTKIYNGNNQVLFKITERFVSGDSQLVKDKIFNGRIPSEITQPNYANFDLFNKRAVDLDDVQRFNDTEVKFISRLHHRRRPEK